MNTVNNKLLHGIARVPADADNTFQLFVGYEHEDVPCADSYERRNESVTSKTLKDSAQLQLSKKVST